MIKVALKMSVLWGARGRDQGRVLESFWRDGLGGLGRTPEAARSRMSTVVLPVVDDVAAAEGGGGVIVAIFVPGLSGGSPVVDPDGSFGVLGGSSGHPGGPVGRS